MIAYKIILLEGTTLKTLFKAIEGSRTLVMNRWLRAVNKWSIDGPGQKPYLTGIHVFKVREVAEAYLNHFRTEKNRIIVECEAKGLRQKPTNPNVYLADRIKIISI